MSRKELISTRKELLILRAHLERIEMATHISDVRDNLSWASFLGASVSGVFRRPALLAVTKALVYLFKDYPMLTTVGSVLLAKIGKPFFRVGAKLGAIAGVAAFAANVYGRVKKNSAVGKH